MEILLVEDDEKLNKSIKIHLERNGYKVQTCLTGDEGLYYIEQQLYDLVILDRMLPMVNGTSILKKVRAKGISTPIIMVTAMSTLNDRISGLDAGADDYLVKPFAMEELMARIRALSRRPSKIECTDVLTFGDLTYNVEQNLIKTDSGELTLSKRESKLMELFIRNPKQVLTRDLIMSRVWGLDTSVQESNLDNYMSFLRRRLRLVGSRLKLVTVHSTGYKLEDNQ